MKAKIKNSVAKCFKRKNIKEIKTIQKKFSFSTKIKKMITNEACTNTIKARNPGIDLGRILSMYAIVLHHVLIYGKIFKKFPWYQFELNKLNTICYWHVNGFIFISGYIGYRSCKYSNLLYLWLCSFFYSLGINIYFNIFKPNLYKKEISYINFFLC